MVVLSSGVSTVSLDVFDTLLIRNTKPEIQRFYEISDIVAKHLTRRSGRRLSREAVFHARSEGHRSAYRLAPWRENQRDASIRLIFKLMLAHLEFKWDEELFEDLCAIELEYEKRNLRLNRDLYQVVRDFADNGGRVFCLSDMYLLAHHLEELLGCFCPVPFWQGIYVSSEYSLCKAGGGLLRLFLDSEGLKAADVLHIGDNRRADVEVPDSLGFKTLQLPAPEWKKAIVRSRNRFFCFPRAGPHLVRRRTFESRRRFARELLGPLLFEFCRRLDVSLEAHPETKVLYEARGGLRLRYLYERFLQLKGRKPRHSSEDFYVSRLSAAKGCLVKDYETVADLFVREFHYTSMGQMLRCISRPLDCRAPKELEHERVTRAGFNDFYHAHSPASDAFRSLFKEQYQLLERYLARLAGGARQIVLVDTGWTGTTQALMMRAFPQYEFIGLYFGRWDTWGKKPWHFHHVYGLMMEADDYAPGKPESCLTQYHHLIEDSMEPRIDSVEYYRENGDGGVRSNVEPDDAAVPPADGDDAFAGIMDYFADSGSLSALESYRAAQRAFRRLEPMVMYPKRGDLGAMIMRPRSADFGKDERVGILFPKRGASVRERIKLASWSIWKQGKLAEEFGPMARFWQYLYNNPRLRRHVLSSGRKKKK